MKRRRAFIVFALVFFASFGTYGWAEEGSQEAEGKEFLPIHGPYLKAIRTALVTGWEKQYRYPFHTLCPLSITQERGGKIVDVIVSSRCMMEPADAALLKARILRMHLPYEGFEEWFWPTIVVDLKSWELGIPAAAVDSPVRVDPMSKWRFNPGLPPNATVSSGSVRLMLEIDPEGDADKIAVALSSGSDEIDQQAKYIAVNLTYFPEIRDGVRVSSIIRVPVVFDGSSTKGTESSLKDYVQALSIAIESQWNRPASISKADTCGIKLNQLPGGTVVGVSVMSDCTFNELGKKSVLAAVLKASPLPYAGFESVFHRTVVLHFRAKD